MSVDCESCPRKITCLRSVNFLCPKLRRSWRGILVSGCASVRACVRPSVRSRTMHARVLKFHIWIPHGKKIWHTFFLVRVISLSGVIPLWKIRTKSDACHILWTMHARVLKFHIWIPHGKIADPCFFVRIVSLSGVMPLWKNQHEILSASYLENYLSC